MARTLTEIYNDAKEHRNRHLELTEKNLGSKMSVLDSLTWIMSACIWTFETVLDVFKIDLVKDLQNRINGTAGYYANALLKYQSGDELEMNSEGTAFSYANVDESKCVVTMVSYSENDEAGFHDKQLVFKIATGEPGAYQKIEEDELLKIRRYLNQISFAGTHSIVVSRKGDVLIPRLTVYHDGALDEEEIYSGIEKALNDFVMSVPFNGVVYHHKVIDAIQSVGHVVDVFEDRSPDSVHGIFVAQYDDDNNLIPAIVGENNEVLSYETEMGRFFVPNSGFLKQSSKTGAEAVFPRWRESITLQVEQQ